MSKRTACYWFDIKKFLIFGLQVKQKFLIFIHFMNENKILCCAKKLIKIFLYYCLLKLFQNIVDMFIVRNTEAIKN